MSKERKAVVTASITAIILIAIKITVALASGSIAILTSAIDSALDFFVSLANFFAIRKAEEPHDDDHNYGHGKIEGFGALFEGLIIFISGCVVIYFSIEKIIHKSYMSQAYESIIVMTVSIVMTFLLVKYLEKVALETQSLVIKADSLHYKSDLYTNAGIIVALVMMKIFNLEIIDPIIGISIALYIMYGSFKITKEGCDMLMDKSIEPRLKEIVINTICSVEDISSYHFMKTRKSGKNIFIEFHVVFKDINISLKKAHMISDKIENEIISEIPNCFVTIHLDYFDDSQEPDNPKIKEEMELSQ